MLLDRPIRLCYGAGDGATKACLMTASNMLVGKAESLDLPTCQCPTIVSFIIQTNDGMGVGDMGDKLRQRYYGDLAWQIIGTRTSSRKVLFRRMVAWARIIDRLMDDLPERLRREFSHYHQYSRVNIQEFFQESKKTCISCSGLGVWESRASVVGSYAGGMVCELAAIDSANWRLARDIILEIIAIGDKRPVELAITPAQLSAALA